MVEVSGGVSSFFSNVMVFNDEIDGFVELEF